MLPGWTRRVNVALPLLALACSPRPPVAEARIRPVHDQLGLQRAVAAEGLNRPNGIREAIARGHLPAPAYATSFGGIDADPPRLRPEPTDMSGLGPEISGASVDDTLGQRLLDYVDENVSSRNWSTYGVASLTYDEIWGTDGTDGLCEEGAILASAEADGVTYEASYGPGVYGSFIGGIDAIMESMDEGCAAALLASGGDIDAALEAGDCDEYTEHTFFPEGSECRSCLEGVGDYAACEDEGACLDEAASASWTYDDDGQKVWARTAVGLIWACAPDLPVPMYLMADLTEEGDIPETFDHEAWRYFCLPYWDEGAREPVYGCSSGAGLGHTIGAGAVGRVNYIREEGASGTPHFDRVWYASSVSLGARTKIKYFWATVPGAGQISLPDDRHRPLDEPSADLSDEPVGSSDGVAGWGFNPHALRPDGTDPEDLDDTYARDWLATLVLKTATTIDGILIQTYNHSRCLSWEGPDDEGRYLCTALGPHDPDWKEDVDISPWVYFDGAGAWTQPGFTQLFYTPMATIASTGLPDDLVPGGAVPLIAGTANLADPDWEDCAWPHQFVPDVAVYEPELHDPGAKGWLWGDAYNFGKDPDLDLRVVLNTNQWRGFCPEREE